MGETPKRDSISATVTAPAPCRVSAISRPPDLGKDRPAVF
jgi:hypothetical protein